mmetsp:Transcript_3473/g.6347  ORF Transcript_3473/g.6347 Transcript_3473/m.6347 type:complete len:80 (+) Transcript_3473:394-633(+)
MFVQAWCKEVVIDPLSCVCVQQSYFLSNICAFLILCKFEVNQIALIVELVLPQHVCSGHNSYQNAVVVDDWNASNSLIH